MNTENVVKHLRALWRTDRIIADIRLRHLLVGLGLRAFAALIAAFGLLMLELSAYFALVQIWSAIAAAAILGAVNFAIATALFAIAGRAPSGRDIELANEIHDTSIEALQLEARALQAQVSGAVHRPLSTIAPVLVPLIAIIIRNCGRRPRHPPRQIRLKRAPSGRAQSLNLTSQISGSAGSGLTSKPRSRHISSMTVFSLSTSPDMVFSPSDFA